MSYNQWLNDESYRSSLLKALKLKGTAEPLNYLTEFGSSFSETLDSSEILGNRWGQFENDKLFKAYASEEQCVEETMKLFSISLPPSLKTRQPAMISSFSVESPPDPNKPTILIASAFFAGGREIESLLASSLREANNYTILHKHNQPLGMVDFEIAIIPLRPHAEVFQIAYFEDSTQTKGYPYALCLGEEDPPNSEEKRKKVLSINADELVKHFVGFDWGQFSWLNQNTTIKHLNDTLEKHVSIQLNSQNYQLVEATHKFTKRPVKILAIRHSSLSDHQTLHQAFKELGLDLSSEAPSLKIMKNKWYTPAYEKLSGCLPLAATNKYDCLDSIL